MPDASIVQRREHVDEAGLPGAPAIVLLHGSVVTRTIWRPQLEALGDTFHVVAPDLPGHGSKADRPFTFDAAVDDVATLMRDLGGRVVLTGLSLGGYVAMLTAARHPHLVAGLVVAGATVNFTGALGVYLTAVAWVMRRGWLRQKPAALEARTRALFPPDLRALGDLQIADGLYPEPLAATFAEMARTDFRAALAAYPGPVLIMNGERDRQPRRGAASFAAAAPRATVVTIAGAGHACNLDAPRAVTEELRAFASRAIAV